MKSYRDLNVWQHAMRLAEKVYSATAEFPVAERYGLISQMRRAVVSVPSNIAEGYGRKTPGQRRQFLENALGSLFELETQVEISLRLGFLRTDADRELAGEIANIGRELIALMRYVEAESRAEPQNRNR